MEAYVLCHSVCDIIVWLEFAFDVRDLDGNGFAYIKLCILYFSLIFTGTLRNNLRFWKNFSASRNIFWDLKCLGPVARVVSLLGARWSGWDFISDMALDTRWTFVSLIFDKVSIYKEKCVLIQQLLSCLLLRLKLGLGLGLRSVLPHNIERSGFGRTARIWSEAPT